MLEVRGRQGALHLQPWVLPLGSRDLQPSFRGAHRTIALAYAEAWPGIYLLQFS